MEESLPLPAPGSPSHVGDGEKRGPGPCCLPVGASTTPVLSLGPPSHQRPGRPRVLCRFPRAGASACCRQGPVQTSANPGKWLPAQNPPAPCVHSGPRPSLRTPARPETPCFFLPRNWLPARSFCLLSETPGPLGDNMPLSKMTSFLYYLARIYALPPNRCYSLSRWYQRPSCVGRQVDRSVSNSYLT